MKVTATTAFKECSFTSSVWTFLSGAEWLGNPTKEYEENYCHPE